MPGDRRPSGTDRWANSRSQRLEAEVSRARRWISRAVDRWEDRLPESVVDVIERLRDGQVLLYAGGLAFYSLVSAVPTFLLIAWMTGSVLGEGRVERLAEQLGELAPGEANMEQFAVSVLDVGMGVGLFALVAALWPATAFGSGLTRAFDAFTPDTKRELSGLRGRGRALVVLVVLPFFLLGGLGAAYLGTGLMGNGAAGTIAGWVIAVGAGVGVTSAAVGAMYWWFGAADFSFRAIASGAAVAAGGMVLMSIGYVTYLSFGANWEEQVAGSGLAALVLLGFWLYLANLMLLAGYCVCLAVTGTTDDV